MSTQTVKSTQITEEFVTLEKITSESTILKIYRESQSLAIKLAHSLLFDKESFIIDICAGLWTRKPDNTGVYYSGGIASNFMYASDRIRQDINVIRKIVERGKYEILRFVDESILKNKDLSYLALSVSPHAYEYLHSDFKNDKQFGKIAVEKYGVPLSLALENFKSASDVFANLDPVADKKKIKQMIKDSPASYLKMPDAILNTMEFAIVAARHGNVDTFSKMPEKFRKSKTVVKIALENMGWGDNVPYYQSMHESLFDDVSMVVYLYEETHRHNKLYDFVSDRLKSIGPVLFSAYRHKQIELEEFHVRGFNYKNNIEAVCAIVNARPDDYKKIFDHSIDIDIDTDEFNRMRANPMVLESLFSGMSHWASNGSSRVDVWEIPKQYVERMNSQDRARVFVANKEGFVLNYPDLFSETLELQIEYLRTCNHPVSAYANVPIEYKLDARVLLSIFENPVCYDYYSIPRDIDQIIKKEFDTQESYLDAFKVQTPSTRWEKDHIKIAKGLKQEIVRINANSSQVETDELEMA